MIKMIKIIGTVRTRTVVCYHCHVLLSYEVSDICKKSTVYLSDAPVGTIIGDYIICPQCKTSIYI